MSQPLPDHAWQRWRAFLAQAFSLSVDERALRLFQSYFDELRAWNAKINLFSVKNDEELLWRHFADSLAGLGPVTAYQYAQRSRAISLVDIGSGAGFPGIPLAILRPELNVTLVESVQKKCAFLEHIKNTLELGTLTILNQRAEELAGEPARRERADIVVSRAFAKLAPAFELMLPLIKKGGLALVYKTPKAAQEAETNPDARAWLSKLGGAWQASVPYAICETTPIYSIIVVRKAGDTPPQYPRRVGVPQKRPLFVCPE